MASAINAFEADCSCISLLIHCDGGTFEASGDVGYFDDHDFYASHYNGTLARLDALNRPVIAALHGTVLGGGLELALACLGHPKTLRGLPELKLGLLLGSLGTQRLPRIVGAGVGTRVPTLFEVY